MIQQLTNRPLIQYVLSIALASTTMLPLVSCENLPGTPGQQGAVGGGAAGAAAGAAVAENSLLGALIGGVLGAGGGYLIGANSDKILNSDEDEVVEANTQAQTNPAQTQDVYGTSTADLNSDGFVTLDEVIAMEDAGLTDDEMLTRLRATDQIYELTSQQNQYLLNRRVSQRVVNELPYINQNIRNELVQQADSDVISRPRN